MGPCLSLATGLYLSRMLGFFHRKETMKEQDHPINIHCLSWWNILHTYWLSSCPSKLTYAFADRTARLGALDLNLGGKWLKNWGNWAQSLFLLDHAWCLPGDAMGLAHCTCVCGALGLVISLSLASSFFFFIWMLPPALSVHGFSQNTLQRRLWRWTQIFGHT